VIDLASGLCRLRRSWHRSILESVFGRGVTPLRVSGDQSPCSTDVKTGSIKGFGGRGAVQTAGPGQAVGLNSSKQDFSSAVDQPLCSGVGSVVVRESSFIFRRIKRAYTLVTR